MGCWCSHYKEDEELVNMAAAFGGGKKHREVLEKRAKLPKEEREKEEKKEKEDKEKMRVLIDGCGIRVEDIEKIAKQETSTIS
ncbi:unnamed protein product [Moneuplotes crassus]|uniref:Uncharacterized protein n=1 Tax=Euplotes crassus TaxID=5936 RepID=A0AAD1Y2N7_EUPCR|nr:unnamed protein product [Moneuplotes crassus]